MAVNTPPISAPPQQDDAFLRGCIRERERLYELFGVQFPSLAQTDREQAIDRAFDECWRGGEGPLVGNEPAFVYEWRRRARFALIRAATYARRQRERAPLAGPATEGEASIDVADETADVIEALSKRESEVQMQELLATLDPDRRRLAVLIFGSDGSQRRATSHAAKLGWSYKRVLWVRECLRRDIVAHLKARESGALCEQRREMLDEYVEWSLARRLSGIGLSDAEPGERWAPLMLHLEACAGCRAQAQALHRLEGRLEHALMPPVIAAPGLLGLLAHLLHGTHARTMQTLSHLLPERVRSTGTGGGIGALLGLSAKTAAGCVALCIATGGGLAAVGVIPLSLGHAAHHPQAAPHYRPALVDAKPVTYSAPVAPAQSVPARPQQAAKRTTQSAPPANLPVLPESQQTTEPPLQGHELPTATRSSIPKADLPNLPPASEKQQAPTSAQCSTPGDLGCAG